MPSSHDIDNEAGLARVRVWGPPEASAAIRAILQLAADPAFEPSHAVLVDVRELDEGDAPLEAIEEVADSLRDLRDRFRGRIAVVAHIGAHLDNLKVMCAFAGTYGLEIQAFGDPEGATGWLTG